MATNEAVEAAAMEIVRDVVGQGYHARWREARDEGSTTWRPEQYDLLDGDMDYCREQGVAPDAVLPRVRALLADAMDACEAALRDGEESALARLKEQGWPETSDGMRAFASDVAADDSPWGEIDGEELIGRDMAVRFARRGERQKLRSLADDADAATSLMDYATGDVIRPSTPRESMASIRAATRDGGAGVIDVDGRRCYAGC